MHCTYVFIRHMWLKSRLCVFISIHGHRHAHLFLSVLFLVSLYFVLKSFFHLFLNPAIVPDENSMEDPLCNSSFGSMVSLDYVTPDTEIGEQFGRWQDLECRGLKNSLVELDRDSSGRVALADFYRGTLDGSAPKQFEFTESTHFLRQNGALDESDPQQPRVLIANYVNSPTNCLTTTSFYSVCCIDECEGLLGHLESHIGAPEVAPEKIFELVAAMPSDTVEAPRNLSVSLFLRLSEVAPRHSGLVALHSRLFAQWMHHAYPRECPFPHITGFGAVTPDERMSKGDRHASEEEMRQYVAAMSVGEGVPLGPSELTWTEEEELFAEQRGSPTSDLLRSFFQCAVLATVLSSVAVNLAKILSSSKTTLFPSSEKEPLRIVGSFPVRGFVREVPLAFPAPHHSAREGCPGHCGTLFYGTDFEHLERYRGQSVLPRFARWDNGREDSSSASGASSKHGRSWVWSARTSPW